ncbi:hypothetical protein MASR2M47_32350 [Draconibacterium sp.]
MKENFYMAAIKDLQDEIRDCDAIINLAGAPILQRWTAKNKTCYFGKPGKNNTNFGSSNQ